MTRRRRDRLFAAHRPLMLCSLKATYSSHASEKFVDIARPLSDSHTHGQLQTTLDAVVKSPRPQRGGGVFTSANTTHPLLFLLHPKYRCGHQFDDLPERPEALASRCTSVGRRATRQWQAAWSTASRGLRAARRDLKRLSRGGGIRSTGSVRMDFSATVRPYVLGRAEALFSWT